ncbi:MAG: hypothetical protein JXA43_03495 [Candidatus Diapherotrites archaeon]|nr:hypothetical protein [Candidatus Diapherotrites archaeon]
MAAKKPMRFRNISELIKFTKQEVAAKNANKPKIIPSKPTASKKPRIIITSKPVPERKVNPRTGKPEPREPRKLVFNSKTKKYEPHEPRKLRFVEGLGYVDQGGRLVTPLHKEPRKLHGYDPKTDTYRGKDGRRYDRKTDKPVN